MWIRDTGEDDDLAAAADAALIGAFADSPQMICRTRLPDVPLPEGVEIRMVTDAAGVADYAAVTSQAYVSLGSPADVTRDPLQRPDGDARAARVLRDRVPRRRARLRRADPA